MTSISDLSDSMSAGQALSTPLLSNLLEHEGDERDAEHEYYDEEESCTQWSLTIVFVDDDEESDEVSRRFDNCVAWFVFPALLFLQFGMAFCMSGKATTIQMGLWGWSVLSYVIFLFVVNAALYREAIKDYKLTWTGAVIVAPEIFINIILFLVIFDQLVAAFLFMLGSILFLTTVVAVVSIRGLITTDSFDEEDDHTLLQDKLDMSLFKGGRSRTTQIV
jgi:hypothetical protein